MIELSRLKLMSDSELYNFANNLKITPLPPILPNTRFVVEKKIFKTLKHRIIPGRSNEIPESRIKELMKASIAAENSNGRLELNYLNEYYETIKQVFLVEVLEYYNNSDRASRSEFDLRLNSAVVKISSQFMVFDMNNNELRSIKEVIKKVTQALARVTREFFYRRELFERNCLNKRILEQYINNLTCSNDEAMGDE